jgi:hypothetical protein
LWAKLWPTDTNEDKKPRRRGRQKVWLENDFPYFGFKVLYIEAVPKLRRILVIPHCYLVQDKA